MREWETVLYSVVNPEQDLTTVLNEALDELNVSVTDLCEGTEITESTMYKIVSGHRQNVQMETFAAIVMRLKRLERGDETHDRTIAIITNRESLEQFKTKQEMGEYNVHLEGYPSSTVEEAIRNSILAERDAVDGIICGPITAYTIEAIVHVPVVGLSVGSEQLEEALKTVLGKMA
jgi:predicted transcriptional regulator